MVSLDMRDKLGEQHRPRILARIRFVFASGYLVDSVVCHISSPNVSQTGCSPFASSCLKFAIYPSPHYVGTVLIPHLFLL